MMPWNLWKKRYACPSSIDYQYYWWIMLRLFGESYFLPEAKLHTTFLTFQSRPRVRDQPDYFVFQPKRGHCPGLAEHQHQSPDHGNDIWTSQTFLLICVKIASKAWNAACNVFISSAMCISYPLTCNRLRSEYFPYSFLLAFWCLYFTAPVVRPPVFVLGLLSSSLWLLHSPLQTN